MFECVPVIVGGVLLLALLISVVSKEIVSKIGDVMGEVERLDYAIQAHQKHVETTVTRVLSRKPLTPDDAFKHLVDQVCEVNKLSTGFTVSKKAKVARIMETGRNLEGTAHFVLEMVDTSDGHARRQVLEELD